MSISLHRNRHLAALQLALTNPISSLRYALANLTGKKQAYKFRVGTVDIWLRSKSPDLTVLRACSLGEFDEAMRLAGPSSRFVIDAGGYIGITSILFAHAFPQAKIICIEPSAENFKMAVRNCKPWQNIEVLNCALSGEAGVTTLKDRETGEWGFSIAADDDKAKSSLGVVNLVTIDDLRSKAGMNSIDLLKLDIEGAEYELFGKSSNWIGDVRVMITELHERIRPGVTQRYDDAVRERLEVQSDAEKRLSVMQGEPVA